MIFVFKGGFSMKKNQLYRALLLCCALSLVTNPLFLVGNQGLPVNNQQASQIVDVRIIEQSESALSLAVADFMSFITGGIKSVFKPIFVMHDKEKELLDTGLTSDKIKAANSAAFRGLIVAIPPLMGILLLGGAKIGLKIIKRDLLTPKPAILNKKQNPVYGRIDRLREWWSSKPMQKMVFNDEVKDRLEEVAKKTILLRELIKKGKNRTYANVLLYGEPGTGKTLFAQQLARQTNMDFLPVTAASLLQKGIEGIQYFDEIIDMANRSPYGAIIFIDEADGLLVDRNAIDPGLDHYKILEHILAVIDSRSDKFMVVAATNRAYLLDSAMNRRFQDQIEMPLPNAQTRVKLVELYVQQILFNEQETNKQFVAAAKDLFVDAVIEFIANATNGLSHAEIADMIEAMRNKAELNKRVVQRADVESAVNQAVAKHKHNEENKKLLKQ